MSIIRAASISYGAFSTGGGYELHGPYSIEQAFGTLSVTWDIVVVSNDPDPLVFQAACESLESALSLRDKNLAILWRGGGWNYTFGDDALNTSCSVVKGGDRETDTGRSRTYRATFTATRPAKDEGGMFAITSSVTYGPNRIREISMSGEVRGQSGASAWDRYQSIISKWDTDIQSVVDSSAVWELQSEEVAFDRTNHVVNFSRVFVELIDKDAPGEDDNPEIVLQRLTYTRISAYPGDGEGDVNRPERFLIEYTCFVDAESKFGLDELSSLYEDSIFDWIKQRFVDEWGPQAFGIVEHRRQFSPSVNQISSKLVVMAYMDGGDVVEATRVETYSDERTIDYTPVWDEDELSAYADQAFMVRLRTVETTKTRLGSHEAEPPLTPGDVKRSGWNRLRGINSATPIFLGEPPDQVEMTTLTTMMVERFTKAPSGEGGGDTAPSTPPPDFGGRTEEELDRQVTGQTDPAIRRPGFVPGSSPPR